jgi:hypothetical protein
MKTNQLLLTGAMIVLTAMGQMSCSSSKTASQSERAQTVKQQIESRHYMVAVNRMTPLSGPSRQLTSSYSLTIKGDTVISYLPYFGQAYSVPYGGGKGLNFEAHITVYTLSFDAKGTALISFQTRSEDDTYLYRIQIFNNGSSSIHVTPNNRQIIHFYGNLEQKERYPTYVM